MQEAYGTADADVASVEYSTADLTGTVIDSGDGVTHVVPIVNGYVVGPAIQSMSLAGSTITSFIAEKLEARGETLPKDKCLQVCRCAGHTAILCFPFS
jgi:actin-related protein 3